MDALKVAKLKKMELVDANGSILVTSTDIRTADEENRLILYGSRFNYIDLGSEITAIAYSEEGLTVFDVVITISTEMQVNLEIKKTHGQQERRNSLKVKVTFRTKVVRVQSNGSKRRFLYQETPIITKDLSMGGICFFANRPFFKNQIVDIVLNPVKQGITARAIILRRNRLRDSGYRYRYGCKFIELSREEERVICEYAFKMQLIEHQRLKDLEMR